MMNLSKFSISENANTRATGSSPKNYISIMMLVTNHHLVGQKKAVPWATGPKYKFSIEFLLEFSKDINLEINLIVLE